MQGKTDIGAQYTGIAGFMSSHLSRDAPAARIKQYMSLCNDSLI